jgi:hypothetical protein
MTDPLAPLRHDERWAGHVVAAVTGAEALPHDVGGAQSAVDITLHYPDGRTGALEVTSHAGSGVKQRDAILADTDHKWTNPGRWGWGIRVGPAVRLNDLRERYGRIITICELHGVTSPELIPWDVQAGDPDLRWLIDHPEVSIVGTADLADPDNPGPVYVMPDLEGGFIDEAIDGLNAAVEDLLAVPHIAGHIPKLLAHQADEHHLFVITEAGSLPGSLWITLMAEVTAPPPAPPRLPDGLTHLWVTTGYGPSLLCATPDGWTDHPVSQPPTDG